MRARAVVVGAALLLLGALGPVAGQERPEAEPDAERRAELLERWRSLPPERQAELRRIYERWLSDRSPAERRRLRRTAHAVELDPERRRRLEGLSDERRRRYQRLIRRVLAELAPAERQALLELPGEERRRRLKALVRSHRHARLERHLETLPAPVRRRLAGELDGLEGRARFRKARAVVAGYVRRRVEAIRGDAALDPREKRDRLRALRDELPGPWRRVLRAQLGGGPGPRRRGGRDARPARDDDAGRGDRRRPGGRRDRR